MSQTVERTSSTEYEQQLRGEVSPSGIQEHLNHFSTLFRDTGSEDEWKAARYIEEKLRGYGLETEILEFDSLISWPLEGKLEVLDGKGGVSDTVFVRTRSFGQQTPPGGTEAELAFVPFQAPEKGAMIFAHRAQAGDYGGIDVRGKIVVTMDGGPDGIRRAEERGALGHIHIWPSDEKVTHEMIGTSVWGTPTTESAKRLPTIPVLGVNNEAGTKLQRACEAGTVRVRMESNVRTQWDRIPLVTGFIPGTESEDFLLVGAHIDSWYEGVTDNATGDVALLEMARVLAPRRGSLKKGVRFCWWPGHSTGRYSGSTWFADNWFHVLNQHALGYLNIDSPGTKGTTIFDCRYNMGEIEHITSGVIRDLENQEPNIRRPLRAGDQSFVGMGLPSLGAFRMLALDHPDRAAVGGCGGAWWWHSPEDTIDKADAAVLAKDVEIYLTIVARMCTPALIPYNFIPSANDFVEHLTTYQESAGDTIDLGPALKAAKGYLAAAEKLAASTASGSDLEVRNRGLKRLSRIVNPALYSLVGPYEMDPALQMPVLPGLAPVAQLRRLDRKSNEYQFLRTEMVRQRNRVQDALLTASRLAEELATKST